MRRFGNVIASPLGRGDPRSTNYIRCGNCPQPNFAFCILNLFLVFDIQRALLDFVVNASDVGTKNADGHKLHAGKEYNGRH